jgi:NAD(P)-dependent dehydrogenase (short-subunit alcohol dehydrogenase family)
VAAVFITGSSDGLGLMAARLLIDQGHEVLLHGRNEGRSRDALAAAPGAKGVVSGDLSTIAGARAVADQVNKLGRFDAVIHNAGLGYRERRVETEPGVPSVFTVNVLAPYILTTLIEKPKRLVYVSSGMHRGARPRMDDLLWSKRSWSGASAYAESKLCEVFAGICRRPPVEGRQAQRAGAWLGSDKDGRPFRAGRSSPRVRNPGVACHE